jgi:hypothetical protein
MFSSTKLENRPHSSSREQRLFYMILVKQMFCRIQHSKQFSEDSAFSCWYVELNPKLCRRVSFEKNIDRLLTFSNVQPGLISNFVPYNNRYDVFYEKYMPIKTSFHGIVLCVALFHTPCIVLNSNATFAFPTPHKSQLLSPKIWETRDQPGPGSFLHAARRVVERAWVRGWCDCSKFKQIKRRSVSCLGRPTRIKNMKYCITASSQY